MSRSALLSFAVIFANTAFATTWYVPGAFNRSDTLSGHLATDLSIHNPSDTPVTATIEFVSSGSATAAAVTRTIAPRQTMRLANVLSLVFGLNETFGAIRVTAAANLVIRARTYQDTAPPAQPGTIWTAIANEDLLEAEDTGEALWLTQNSQATAGVLFAPVNSSVDIVVYDAMNKELGRTTVAGNSTVVETPVASIVPAGVPLGRVEFQVNAGRIAAYLRLQDAATGKLTGLESATAFYTTTDTATSVSPDSVSTDGRFQIRTDARVLNLSLNTATATAVLENSTAANATLSLKPGELREIPDVLSSWFSSNPSGAATIHVTASDPIIVVYRTVITPTDGSAGILGGFNTGIDRQPDGSQLILAGLGATDTVTLAAGVDGATVQFTGWDPSGASVDAASLSVSLNPNETRDLAIQDWFSGSTAPPNVTLQALVQTGEAGAVARFADTASGDFGYAGGVLLLPYACAAPVIDGFYMSAANPGAPGPVTVNWSTSLADTVAVSGVPGPYTLSGSATVMTTASATFTLTATNSCVTAQQTAVATIGAPTLMSVNPSSAPPGDLISILPGNVADPSLISGAIFTFSDGVQRELSIDSVNSDGSLSVRTPLFRRNGSYFSGALTISLDSDAGVSAQANFTILPLAPSTDSVTFFLSVLNDVDTWVTARLNDFKTNPDFAATVPILQAGHTADLADLRKALTAIAGSGSAALPVDLPTPTTPTPATVMLKRADLDQLMTMLTNSAAVNIIPGVTASSPKAGSRSASLADSNQWALLNNPSYKQCLDVQLQEINSVLNRGALDVLGDVGTTLIDTLGDGIEDFGKIPVVVMVNRLRKLAGRMEFVCNLYPIELQYFRAVPFPNPVPFTRYSRTDEDPTNMGTNILAGFRSPWTRDQAAANLVSVVQDGLEKQLNKFLSKKTPNQQQAIQTLIKQALDQLNKSAEQEVAQILQQYKLSGSTQEKVVYKLDINTVVPEAGQRLLEYTDYEKSAEDQFPDTPAYGFSGDKRSRLKPGGGTVNLVLLRELKHFFDINYTKSTYGELRGQQPIVVKIPISVGRGEREVEFYYYIQPMTLQSQDFTNPQKLKEGGSLTKNPAGTFPTDCYNGGECDRTGALKMSIQHPSLSTWTFSISSVTHGENGTLPGGSPQGKVSIGMNLQFPPESHYQQKIVLSGTATSQNQPLVPCPSMLQSPSPCLQTGRHNPVVGCTLDATNKDGQVFAAEPPGTGKSGSVTKSVTAMGATQGVCNMSVGGDGEGSSSATLTIQMLRQ